MVDYSQRKVVLITRKTRLEELIYRFNNSSQAKFYIEHLGADFSEYEKENAEYQLTVALAKQMISSSYRMQEIDRSFLPNYLFDKTDIIVVIGQDGMVANTLKYLDGQYLIGINPSPDRFDGVLLPFTVNDLSGVLPETINEKRSFKEVSIAKARLKDGQEILGVNDIFIGQKSHVSARYEIQLGTSKENQSSSGIIVSTGLGSTGWLKSVFAGAKGIMNSISNKKENINAKGSFRWDSNYLYFSVREPYPSKSTSANLVFGKITNQNTLKIVSKMPENGVIFSDGVESDFLQFNSGMQAEISLHNIKGKIVT